MFRPCSLSVCLFAALLISPALAEPTAEQRRELSAIQRDVSGVSALIRKKEYEEAEKTLAELKEKADKLIADGGFPPTDRAVVSLKRLLVTNMQRVTKALDKPDPTLISFSRQIAPLISSRCGNCHGADNSRGQLNLSTFGGFRQGGQNGPLLIPKQPLRSLLMAKLASTDAQARMPRGGNPLSATELQTIYDWIEQGAVFDGDNEATPLADLGKAAPANQPPPEPVTIVKATGNETVSFVRDIAPTIVNLCTGCHGANNPNNGLSVVTFESLMRGGDNGRVILPGNLEGSKLWRLVGAGDQPRMPQGQARITRKFHADLQKWIEEGAKFDAEDAKTPLRSLVPTEEDLAMERLAKLTPEEFRELRETRTADQWKRVSPRVTARFVSSAEFLVYGDASEERLKQVNDWAEQHAQELKSVFGINSSPIWKGRLTVFVMSDRFGYTEFNQVIQSRSTPNDLHGHALVTAGFEDAFVVVEDIGDEPGATHGGLRLNLVEQITGAYLRQPGPNLPEWLVRGTGLALARKSVGPNAYLDSMPALAIESLKGLERPEDVFTDNRFGPGEIGPVGFTVVDFMIKGGGPAKFGQLIRQMRGGANAATAVAAVYPPTDLKALGTAYLQSLAGK